MSVISLDAPIGYIWLVPFPNKLKKGVHPLPNTRIYPYQQNLKTTAEIHSNRDVIVHYFGSNLTEEQVLDMQNLTKFSPNIKTLDFFSMDWENYDFSFLYNDTTITLLEFLKMDNSDNLLGLRKDIAEHLLLLHHPKGIIFIDFDNKILEPILEPLPTDIGILCGWDTEMENRFNFFVNNAMVTSGPNIPILNDAFDMLQQYLVLNGIDTELLSEKLILTSQNFKFKNLNDFTGEWKMVLLMCDLQCCSIVNALAEKFGIGAFDKELIEKSEPTTAFKHVLSRTGSFLLIDSDGSRTWIVDNKYQVIFNNMYHIHQLPLKTEFRATANYQKPLAAFGPPPDCESNPVLDSSPSLLKEDNDRRSSAKLHAHVIIDSKVKFNMAEQFAKMNPNRKTFFYTFQWITIPKHFKFDVTILENYAYTPSVTRLAMVNILYEKGGVCYTVQHNPFCLPEEVDEREITCLKGCDGRLCGSGFICFDVVAVDRPKHKILCEVQELIKDSYDKFGMMVTLNHQLYLDTHPNYVEYTFNNGKQLTEKIVDTYLWYAISGRVPSVQAYKTKISFETLVQESREYCVASHPGSATLTCEGKLSTSSKAKGAPAIRPARPVTLRPPPGVEGKAPVKVTSPKTKAMLNRSSDLSNGF
jgi:hypothetical protein